MPQKDQERKIKEHSIPASSSSPASSGLQMSWNEAIELAGSRKFSLSEDAVEKLSAQSGIPKEEFRLSFEAYQMDRACAYARIMSQTVCEFLLAQGGRKEIKRKLEKDASILVSRIKSAMQEESKKADKQEKKGISKFISALDSCKSPGQIYLVVVQGFTKLPPRLRMRLHYALESSGSALVFREHSGRSGYILANIPRLEFYANSPVGEGLYALGFYADRPVYDYIIASGAVKDDGRIALFDSFLDEMFSSDSNPPQLGHYEFMSLAGMPWATQNYDSGQIPKKQALTPQVIGKVDAIDSKYPNWKLLAYFAMPNLPESAQEFEDFPERFAASLKERILNQGWAGRKISEKEAEDDAYAIVVKSSLDMLGQLISPQGKQPQTMPLQGKPPQKGGQLKMPGKPEIGKKGARK